MVRKKRGKKVAGRKAPVKSKLAADTGNRAEGIKKRIRRVVKNLIALIILTLVSYVLYSVSVKDFYVTFFGFASAILGFISVALLIVLLILIFLKLMQK